MSRANFYTNASGTKVEIKLSTNNQTGTGTGPTGTGPTGTRKYCTVLYSTVQYCTYSTLFWHEWPSWKGYGRDIKTKDLSFYIGFTRIQSRIKHLGPCFGMNGHFRRDLDMISRLSKSTIDFLSVFICFRS